MTFPTPAIGTNQVLIRTKAIGINPIDIQVRDAKNMLEMITGGNYPEKVILGWDVAGIVEQVGGSVQTFQPGDEVYGLINMPGLGSTYATHVVAPAEQVSFMPRNLSFVAAGATPMAALTAWQAVVTLGQLQQGEKVLIHGASGGVGHFAVQFAKARGAYVTGTASAKNEAFVRNLGVDEFLDYTAVPFETKISDVDVVIDTIHSVDHIARSITVIKKAAAWYIYNLILQVHWKISWLLQV
ncbi:NADP-dependent oxidoreductase [Chitinophaga sp.]|uniref:NADP-dependent oxidoreductase n=1 Tax=Chitinophaga sp. TaxID=1869181 RepID=UPI0031D91C96